jgi:hypothetical protein
MFMDIGCMRCGALGEKEKNLDVQKHLNAIQ